MDHVGRALERDELRLEYQPAFCLASGRLTKAEALLRWHSPSLGRVAPDEFIPVMERAGLICDIGRWVLEQACQQAVAWRRLANLEVPVSINVSPLQLESGDFPALLMTVAQQHECDPEWLGIELTEHSVVRSFPIARRAMSELALFGVHVAIDDFGAGYSSLKQLAELPVHCLKLDRGLIAGIEHDVRRRAIVSAIVALCEALGLAITMEGVELQEQARFLRRFRSIEVQGFLFGRPGPAQDIVAASTIPAGARRARLGAAGARRSL